MICRHAPVDSRKRREIKRSASEANALQAPKRQTGRLLGALAGSLLLAVLLKLLLKLLLAALWNNTFRTQAGE